MRAIYFPLIKLKSRCVSNIYGTVFPETACVYSGGAVVMQNSAVLTCAVFTSNELYGGTRNNLRGGGGANEARRTWTECVLFTA